MKRILTILCCVVAISLKLYSIDLSGTEWRCTSKECLEWAPEGTIYVEMIFKNDHTLRYVYKKKDPIYTKVEIWHVISINDYVAVSQQERSPDIPIEINGNILVLKNSLVWKEKPDFVFKRIK